MRSAGPTLLLLITLTGGLLADEPTPAPPAKTSPRLSQEIRAGLPKFTPPPASPSPSPAEAPDTPRDPEVIVLPKITVVEKRIPTNDPDVWLTGRAVQQKAMAAYKDSMTPLEWLLNGWYIPLFSAPPSVRARQYYEDRKLADEIDRLNSIVKAVGLTDPNEAARLWDAMDTGKLPKEGR
jgi:hypothetical protein